MEIKKQNVWHSPSYRKWIASLPCVVCKTNLDIQCAHVEFIAPREQINMMGKKVDDRYCVPLCVSCHASQHTHPGEGAWWAKQDRDPAYIAETLKLAWDKWSKSAAVLQTYAEDFILQ